jgi:hypothetical protein
MNPFPNIPTLTTTSVSNLVTRCMSIPVGTTYMGLKVSLKGVVGHVKTEFGSVPLIFRVASLMEMDTTSILVRWLPNNKKFSPHTKEENFEWVNDNLEEECQVEVNGFLHKTKKGKAMIDALNVKILSHPEDSEDLDETREQDEYEYKSESESESDEKDKDFVPETDSEAENDDRDFEENVEDETSSEEEEEEEEEEERTPALLSKLKINKDITLTNDKLFFHGCGSPIMAMRTKPGRVTLKSDLGNFHFDRMDEQYVSVLVPANRFEPSFKHGYTTLVKVDFRKILEILL